MDSLHPAVKALVAGKRPKNSQSPSSVSSNSILNKDVHEEPKKLEAHGDMERVGKRSPLNVTAFPKSMPDK